MVISVFPDVSQGFARYEQSRRNRLIDQQTRTEQEAMRRRRAAFNQMLGQIEDPQQRLALEAGGVEGVPAFNEGQRRAQAAAAEAAAEAAEAAREQQVAFLEDWGGRYARERATLGDEFDENAFMRNARVAATTSGVPMSHPDDPNALPEAIRSYSTGVDMDEPRAGGSEFERISMALTNPDLDPVLRSAYEARLERLTGPGGMNVNFPGEPVDPSSQIVTSDMRAAMNIPDSDTRPYIYTLNSQGRITGAEPLGELPEPTLLEKLPNARRTRQYEQSQISNLETVIDLVAGSRLPATGLVSGVLEEFRGTNAAMVRSFLQSVTGDIALERIEALRAVAAEQNQRGSGLGQITEREIAILERARGALSTDMRKDVFLQEANRILEDLRAVEADRRRIMQEEDPALYQEVYGSGAGSEDDEIEDIQNFFENPPGSMGPQ